MKKSNPTEKESLQRVVEIAKLNAEIENTYDMECLERAMSFVKYYDEIMNSKGYEIEGP
jgi:hypothetical protein